MVGRSGRGLKVFGSGVFGASDPGLIGRLWRSAEWQFFAELPRVNRRLAISWWALILLRGLLPASFAVATGVLVAAVQRDDRLAVPLIVVGGLFIAVQILAPLQAQVSAALGDRLVDWLNDRLLDSTVRPSGLAHLESPELTDDLALARDFELGYSGPPMSLAMAFTAGGLTELAAGAGQVLVLGAYRWWTAVLVGGAWASTHWLLRTPTVWDRLTGEVLEAQRQAEYAYRLAMDPPAAKEVRVFGLSDWVVGRFTQARRRLVDIRWHSARLRRGSVLATVSVLIAANGICFWSLAHAAASGAIGLAAALTFAQAGVGASALAFGGLDWSLPHAAHAVATVRRLDAKMLQLGTLPEGSRSARQLNDDLRMPATELRFRDVGFRYGERTPDVLDHLDLVVPAGSSLAVVGLNGAGKTTLVKLLCRLYDPTAGAIEVDGVDLRELDLNGWRGRVTAVFQDYIRYELPLRENVAPLGGTDQDIRAALIAAGADSVADLDTVLAAGYGGGIDLSGGQWQRVALARVLYAVGQGAELVILDEPTAQLDVRGEAEIFERILTATRGCTTILISHRFSTVRQADRICVLEQGRVVELGTHSSLMDAGGRYRTMFELQAARFGEEEPDDRIRV